MDMERVTLHSSLFCLSEMMCLHLTTHHEASFQCARIFKLMPRC